MNAVIIDVPGPAVMETPRLRLRPYAGDDLEPMAQMFGDPEARAFTSLGVRDRTQTQEVLESYMTFLATHGWGMFAIFDRGSGRYLGEAGLFVSPMESIALRYALIKPAWGQGYAVEASSAVIDDAFVRMGLTGLDAGVKDENTASVRVMQKLGFTFNETITAGGHTFGVYSLTAAEWSARKSRGQGG